MVGFTDGDQRQCKLFVRGQGTSEHGEGQS